MNIKSINDRIQYLKENQISYNELLNLSSDDCVKVNTTYFYFLLAKTTLLNIRDKNILEIFSKYLEIDSMNVFVNGYYKGTSKYYLMSVNEIKLLIQSLNDIPNSRTFIKTDINESQLNERINNLKQKYIEKKNESITTSLDNTDNYSKLVKRKIK